MRITSKLAILIGLVCTARAQTLVTADWLYQRRADAGILILDTRPQADYRKGHIHGAVLVNVYDYMVDSSPQGEKAFHEALADIFGRAGVRPSDRVVFYEERLGVRAARGYWMLRYAGHRSVDMLEGGLDAWRRKKYSISTEPRAPRAASRFRVQPQAQVNSTARGLAARLRDPQVVILDVRRRDEYDGKERASDCPRQGHIPGAVWLEWTEFLSADGSSFKPAPELRALLQKHGVTPDKEVVTYCHRGVRSAAAWAALDSLGFRKARNYGGSWHDWAEKKELPIE